MASLPLLPRCLQCRHPHLPLLDLQHRHRAQLLLRGSTGTRQRLQALLKGKRLMAAEWASQDDCGVGGCTK